MLDKILQTLRDNKLATGLIFILVYVLIFGFEAAGYVAIAEVFTFIYLNIIASGDDDDFDNWKFA